MATGALRPLRDLEVTVSGRHQRFVDLPACPKLIRERPPSDATDVSECIVPVRWLAKRKVCEEVFETGMRIQQVP